jgi:HSP20 family protein
VSARNQTTRPERSNHVTSWDPFDDLQEPRQQFSQALQGLSPLGAPAGAFVPLADIEETDDAFLVELDVPDVDKGDVDVELSGQRLVVSGERKEKERTGVMRRRTRRVGEFRAEVIFPVHVDNEGVEASLNSGTLTIRAPKSVGQRRRQISID